MEAGMWDESACMDALCKEITLGKTVTSDNETIVCGTRNGDSFLQLKNPRSRCAVKTAAGVKHSSAEGYSSESRTRSFTDEKRV